MRSASLAATGCLNAIGTTSLLTGADHARSGVGLAEPPTGRPPACRVCGSEIVPLTRCPVASGLGSATVSGASPAVEITVAVVLAR